jgi:4-hydroxy-tetrahydrodipicolinate synthase
MNMKFKGVIPILVTPFNNDESVDVNSIHTMIQLMKNIEVDAVTILGVLGEANRLTDDERKLVISSAVEAADQLPIIVGTSSAGTRTVVNHNEIANKLGATAVMVTPHAEPTPSEERIFNHFDTVLRAASVPVILQDHPASTGVHMSDNLIFRMLDELTGFAGIKLESVPTAPTLRSLKSRYKDQIHILTGLGALYGAYDLEAGSDGFNTGFAFPEVLIALLREAKINNWSSVFDIYQRFLPLIVYEQHPGVAIRKELLKLRGAITNARVRSPGAQGTEDIKNTLKHIIKNTLQGTNLTKPVKL